VTFDAPADDGFGGHVESLFQNIPVLRTALAAILPQPPVQVEHGNAGS
jgi:hypothetical protein